MNTRLTMSGSKVNNRKKMRVLKLNEIHHGDCLELMKDIPDGSVDMILCDLPYGTTANKWDSIIPLEKLWGQYERVIKDRGVVVLTAIQPFTSMLITSNPDLYKYNWIYQKNQGIDPMMAKIRPLNDYEDIVVFYKEKPTYNPQMTYVGVKDKRTTFQDVEVFDENKGSFVNKRPKKDDGWRYPKRVIKFKIERGIHPTQKPVTLFEYLIKTYTNEGEVVLDNCMGSGTTAIAALNTNRTFIGIEKEKEYVDIANERIKLSQLSLELVADET